MYQIEGQVLLRRDAHSARQLRDFHIVAFDDGVGHLRFFPSADAEPVGAAREEAGADSSAGSPGEEVPGPPVKRVFFILSHWDRPDQLRRWMHSIRRVRASDPQVGICLANFLAPSTNPRRNKVVLGASTLATITHADLVEWTGVEDALLVEFGPELPFSKTRAFNACFQALAAGVRPRADDILFFTDVDIQLPAGIGHELRRFVRTGWQAFAPVVRYEHCEWVYGSGPPPGYLGEGDDQPIAERIAGRPLATDEVHDGAIFSSAPRRHRARRSDYFDPPANVSPGSEEYEEMVELPDGPGPWATGPDAPDSASEDADGANGDPASGPGQMAVSPEERLTAGDRAEDLRTADWAADDRCWGDGGYGLVAMAAADFYRLAAGNGFTASGGPGGRQGTNVDPAEASHIWDAAVDQLAEELEEHICLRIAGAITKVREPALPSIPPGLLVRATGGQAVACPAAVAGRQATHRRGDMTGGGYRVGALHWDVPRRGAQAEAGSKPRAGGEHTPEDLPAGAGGTPVAEDDEPEQAPAPAGAFAGLQRTTAGPYRVDLFDRRAGFEDTDTLLRAKRLPVCITRRRHPQLLHSWHPPSRWNFVRNKPGLGAGAGGAEAFHSATNVC
ncbi:hypothetical protein H696_03038 [Fonticula alba]|uniref:Uncharacterized protein n=1 Tax=Fonticula alba TaxID=691883 RepID=A0A058Z8Q1_FONAL|nr:hypothetical protein H696_03038 [Fonticula alba]KCV70684.1 hypothetical protein H696_03038 [Fonticula alba]|eukprot:XP_009495200.1 hypothetical protein H696_03038 [Fonticula alba]